MKYQIWKNLNIKIKLRCFAKKYFIINLTYSTQIINGLALKLAKTTAISPQWLRFVKTKKSILFSE